MIKNWLLRTKSRQILGPVSRKKVIELIEKGSLTENDEICTGNGFWFYVKEKELVKQYLYDEELASFNPVQEASSSSEKSPKEPQTAIININDIKTDESQEGEQQSLPDSQDLEYPEDLPEQGVEEKKN